MYYIGVDLGGTNIVVGIVSEDGEILLKKSVPTLNQRDWKEIVHDITDLCLETMKEFGITKDDVHSIGIGSPGIVAPKEGVITYSNNLRFENVPIRDEMQKKLDLPIYLENDANAAALGESFSGAAKNATNSVMITIGTGLGGGVIIDGKIYNGSFFGGGELGHSVIKVGGEPCTCGRKGCWEAYSSATALIRDSRIAAARNLSSGLANCVNGDLKLITAKTPFDAAEEGDPVALKVIDNYFSDLSEGIANMINIFQPEIFVLGGGICSQGDTLLLPVRERVNKLVYGGRNMTEILIATLGNDAGIIGAAMLGFNS